MAHHQISLETRVLFSMRQAEKGSQVQQRATSLGSVSCEKQQKRNKLTVTLIRKVSFHLLKAEGALLYSQMSEEMMEKRSQQF